MRVLATLIDGRDETHRWASGYDRDVVDIQSVTTEVASAIAEAVVSRLLPVTSAASAAVARSATPPAETGAAATGWSRREWATGIVTSGTRWSSSLTR